jgi:hypothetical protein
MGRVSPQSHPPQVACLRLQHEGVSTSQTAPILAPRWCRMRCDQHIESSLSFLRVHEGRSLALWVRKKPVGAVQASLRTTSVGKIGAECIRSGGCELELSAQVAREMRRMLC